MSILLLLITGLGLASGHGNMIFPPVWFDRGGKNLKIGCGVLDLPDDTEYSQTRGKEPDCVQMWFSNNVTIPGEPSIPSSMSQPEVQCVGQTGAKTTHPWNAPGTAPVHGPCGTLGGWPEGCFGNGTGTFGDCCGNNCDSFALGKNAEEYDLATSDIPVTEWLAGSHQEVNWYVSANHAGGYSYRLCRMPEGGPEDLTEECFQETPLDFAGENQWVVYGKDQSSGHRTEIPAKRTREGTFPPGSMWTANPLLPPQEEGGDRRYGHGNVVDKVVVPEGLEPGEYVLSFRWDTKCSPQVWGVCSNVKII